MHTTGTYVVNRHVDKKVIYYIDWHICCPFQNIGSKAVILWYVIFSNVKMGGKDLNIVANTQKLPVAIQPKERIRIN